MNRLAHRARRREERIPRFGQRETLVMALKELGTELLLHRVNLPPDRGLTRAEHSRSGREAAVLGDGEERLHQGPVEGRGASGHSGTNTHSANFGNSKGSPAPAYSWRNSG